MRATPSPALLPPFTTWTMPPLGINVEKCRNTFVYAIFICFFRIAEIARVTNCPQQDTQKND